VFQGFYADTALCGGASARCAGFSSTAPTMLCLMRRLVPRAGRASGRLKVIASLDIAQSEKEKICYRNAQQLFKLQ
jgi:hypothetical protein